MVCLASFAKLVICGVNVAILVAVVIAGAVIYNNVKSEEAKSFYDLYSGSTAFTIFIGVIVLVCITTLIGLALICFDPQWFRIVYFVFLFVVVLMEIITIGVVAKFKNASFDYLYERWNDKDNEKVVNEAQKVLKCCGFNETNATIEAKCKALNISEEYLNLTCQQKIVNAVKDNLQSFLIGTIVLAVFQIILLGLSLWWGFCYKEEDHITNITNIG
jgi:hypothetical protein